MRESMFSRRQVPQAAYQGTQVYDPLAREANLYPIPANVRTPSVFRIVVRAIIVAGMLILAMLASIRAVRAIRHVRTRSETDISNEGNEPAQVDSDVANMDLVRLGQTYADQPDELRAAIQRAAYLKAQKDAAEQAKYLRDNSVIAATKQQEGARTAEEEKNTLMKNALANILNNSTKERVFDPTTTTTRATTATTTVPANIASGGT
jgi:predicted RNA-binding protein YlxR (DUF448 family)